MFFTSSFTDISVACFASRGALVIRWLGDDEVVPLEELDAVYSGQRLGKLGDLWHDILVHKADLAGVFGASAGAQ